MSDVHMSDDDEYEEETVHILLDLGTNFAAEALEQMASENTMFEILDLESGSPYVKFGDTIFRGHIDETVTTNLLFEITERKRDTSGLLPLLSSMRHTAEEEETDPQQQHEASFQRLSATYVTEADKVISCQRITLVPRGSHELVQRGTPDDDEEDITDILMKEDESIE